MISQFGLLGGEESSEREDYFRRVFHRALRKAALSGLFWRLLAIGVLSASLLVPSAIEHLYVQSTFPVVFLITALLWVGSLFFVRRVKTLSSMSFTLGCSYLLLFACWFAGYSLGTISPSVQSLSLALIIITLGLIPSIGVAQDCFYALIVGFSVFLYLFNQEHAYGLALLLLGVLSYRNAVTLGLENLVSAGTVSLLRMRDDLDERLLKSLMLEGLSLIFRVNRFGVAQEGNPSLFCHRLKNSWIASHHTPISEIAPEVIRLEGEAGIIRPAALGYEFSLRIREVFGFASDSIAFYTIGDPTSSKRVRLFFPMGHLFSAVGRPYGFRLGLLYFLIVSQGLRQSQVREQGTTRFRETATLLEAQQSDLNHIIHLVNNVTQELSTDIYPDGFKKQGGENGLLFEIGDSLHALAAEVSDFRLAREVSELIDSPSEGTAYLSNFQHSIERYAHSLARRFAFPLRETLPDLDANLIFREDETVGLLYARTLMRLIVSQHEGSSSFVLEGSLEGGLYRLRFHEEGHGSKKRTVRSGAFRRLSSVEQHVVRSLDTLKESLPYFEVEGASNGDQGLLGFSISLPVELQESFAAVAASRWILFVDDNQQILNLYGRIAEALQFPFKTAPSIEGTLKHMAEDGFPSLLVMDLQLSDGSGEELLLHLREKDYGDGPILVISGEDLQDFRKIASRFPDFELSFLSKPISQQVLIQAMKERMASRGRTTSHKIDL